MYKLNDILLSDYGIIPGRVKGEGIAVKGIFDLPKRIDITHYDWGDDDSVQPYVDSDEIFFGGRDIYFAGIIQGTRVEVEVYLKALHDAINIFPNRVIFETPYGDYCVYVKKIIPKFYRNGATLKIDFREPDITSDCDGGTPPPPPTIYFSADTSRTVRKNDCDTGFTGSEETLFASDSDAFPWESTLSQAAADQLAIDWVLDNVNLYANNNGTCTVNPITYYNVELTGSLAKDDCQNGQGTNVSYTVPADTYSSQVSQAAADQLAQDEIDANLTQAYANANGECENVSSITPVVNYSTGVGGFRWQSFLIGPVVTVGAIYKLAAYSHTIEYTAQGGDTPEDIVDEMIDLVNNTSATQWDEQNSAPAPGTPYFPPTAQLYDVNAPLIFIVLLNHQNQFAAWVTLP